MGNNNKNKPKYLTNVGVQGRNAGISLGEKIEKDEDGFQDIDSVFENIIELKEQFVKSDEEQEHFYDIPNLSPELLPTPSQQKQETEPEPTVGEEVKVGKLDRNIELFSQIPSTQKLTKHTSPNKVNEQTDKDKLKMIQNLDASLKKAERISKSTNKSSSYTKKEPKLEKPTVIDEEADSLNFTERKIKLRPNRPNSNLTTEQDFENLISTNSQKSTITASVKSKGTKPISKAKKKFEEEEYNFSQDVEHFFSSPDPQFEFKPFTLLTPHKSKPTAVDSSYVLEDVDLLLPKTNEGTNQYVSPFKSNTEIETESINVVSSLNSDSKPNLEDDLVTSTKAKSNMSVILEKTNTKRKVEVQSHITESLPTETKSKLENSTISVRNQSSPQFNELAVKPRQLGPKSKSRTKRSNNHKLQPSKLDSNNDSNYSLSSNNQAYLNGAKVQSEWFKSTEPELNSKVTLKANNPGQVKVSLDSKLQDLVAKPDNGSNQLDGLERRSRRMRAAPKKYWEVESTSTTAPVTSNRSDGWQSEEEPLRKSIPKPKSNRRKVPNPIKPTLDLLKESALKLESNLKENNTEDPSESDIEDGDRLIKPAPKSKRRKVNASNKSNETVGNFAEVGLGTQIIPFPLQGLKSRTGSKISKQKHFHNRLVTATIQLEPNQTEPSPEERFVSTWVLTIVKGKTEVIIEKVGNKVVQQGDLILVEANTNVRWFNKFDQECWITLTKVRLS